MPKTNNYVLHYCDDCEENFMAEVDGGKNQCPHCGSLDTWCDEEDEADDNDL